MPIGHLTQIPPGTPPPAPPAPPVKYFLGNASFPIFVFLVFGFIFAGAIFYLRQTTGASSATPDVFFGGAAIFYGLVFCGVSLAVMYFLYGLKKLFGLAKIYWLNPVISALTIYFWWFLVAHPSYLNGFLEEEGDRVLTYYSLPFLFSVSICLGLCCAWFFIAVILSIKNRGKRQPKS